MWNFDVCEREHADGLGLEAVAGLGANNRVDLADAFDVGGLEGNFFEADSSGLVELGKWDMPAVPWSLATGFIFFSIQLWKLTLVSSFPCGG